MNFGKYVRRKSGFYIWKICSVLVTIVLMAIPIFMIDVSELAERLNLALTLFLAAVAFNFVIMDSLPKIGYLTWIDTYTLGSYAATSTLIIVSVLTHAIHLGHFEGQGLSAKDASNVNRVCALLFVLGKFQPVLSSLVVASE